MRGNWPRILLFLLSIGLFLFLIAGSFIARRITTLPISSFLEKISDGSTVRLWISDDRVVAQRTDNTYLQTIKEPGISFWELARDTGADEIIAEIPLSVSSGPWREFLTGLFINILPILLIAFLFWKFSSNVQRGAGQIFNFSKSGVKVYNPAKDRVTFDSVAGLPEAKEELQEIVSFLKQPERFVRLGAKPVRGVLLIGPSGTGKTLLARAVAGEAEVPFFYISGSEFVELFVGVGSARVRDLFMTAKRSGPSIIFIDEIDAVGRMRGAGIGGGHDEREQTLNQILVEMDGFEIETRVVVLAATNRPDVLDTALLRPGRFDRRVTVDLPDIQEREEIIRLHLKNKIVHPKIQVRAIAERTPGFSGAELANLCNEGAILAARKNQDSIEQADLLSAIEKVLLGPEKKSRIISKEQKKIAAFHEAGHALVAHHLPHADPVQKVSIVARGRAGGYTLKVPLEEKSFHFKSEFLDELTVLLAGYAAEKIVFNDTSTGASHDLQVATDLTRQIVTRYGMSTIVGPVAFGALPSAPFLGRDILIEKNYSEQTAQVIDSEIRSILQRAAERAQQLINKKKRQLNAIAQKLIKNEVIEQEAFQKLLGEPRGLIVLPW